MECLIDNSVPKCKFVKEGYTTSPFFFLFFLNISASAVVIWIYYFWILHEADKHLSFKDHMEAFSFPFRHNNTLCKSACKGELEADMK